MKKLLTIFIIILFIADIILLLSHRWFMEHTSPLTWVMVIFIVISLLLIALTVYAVRNVMEHKKNSSNNSP